jgi:putative tryptophan/tyrosine transport system substrate-binding protein
MAIQTLIVLLVGLALAFVNLAEAQQPKKVARVGYLVFGSPPPSSVPPNRNVEAFYQGLREVGYTEGKNLIIEYRYAKGNSKRFRELAAELVSSKVDLILATTGPAIEVARRATTTIPIVMLSVGDPVDEGIIDSLARPGRNITGVTGVIPALSGKLLQLLVDAVPGANRVGVLWDIRIPERSALTETENAARALRVRLKIMEVGSRDEFEKAFIATTKDRSRGVVILPALLFTTNQKRIAELSIKSRLPAIYWQRRFAEVGGLLAYGPSLPDQYHRIGVLAGKILNGTKPAELPVEQPTKYELVVNLRTAKQIGVTIPQSLLFRADSVIK